MTNRALVLAALAESPSTILGALDSRDTALMAGALAAMGTRVERSPERPHRIDVTPGPLHQGSVDCGLAGTVMRFVPPVAALATGDVEFDGDPQARKRPLGTVLSALRGLGVRVDGDQLPCTVHGAAGEPVGGEVTIDASASSQFVTGLLLSGARFPRGIVVRHSGSTLPSMPHIEMTVHMLRQAGVDVDTSQRHIWSVAHGPIRGGTWRIEPDLSNATPFLAAAAVTGGTVRIPNWPTRTTQPGDAIRGILHQMGCQVTLVAHGDAYDLEVTGPATGELRGITTGMSDIGELTPTVAALAALASTPSTLTGIAHLRGHETDRLAALAREITRLGGRCTELPDGLRIQPSALTGGVWRSYADHRMATAGAILGLVVPGVQVEDIATTAKTLPDFPQLWADLVGTARG